VGWCCCAIILNLSGYCGCRLVAGVVDLASRGSLGSLEVLSLWHLHYLRYLFALQLLEFSQHLFRIVHGLMAYVRFHE
jgi:hypothetical protein